MKEEDAKRKLRLAKARMIKFEKSDDENDNNNGEMVYKDPVVIEPELPAEDKFFYDWTLRNQEE